MSSWTGMSDPRTRLKEYHRKRDFTKTPEPKGAKGEGSPAARAAPRRPAPRRRRGDRIFVIQKHAARRTHFDLRLEVGGALKSWAVPKGPSLDPREKRLAVAVEDHPLDYAEFEGVIPEGEYGAGPVILWDRGTYRPIYPSEDATDEELEEGYGKGKVEFELFGERLKGTWGLIRIRGSAPGDEGRQPWLLIKKKDAHAAPAAPATPGRDVVAEYETSVVSGRTLAELREEARAKKAARRAIPVRGTEVKTLPDFKPMLAELAGQLPGGAGWCYEEKLDGVRVIARAKPQSVELLSRTGQRLDPAFPEVTAAVAELAQCSGAAFVLDGELAVRTDGRTRFADLQPRINLKDAREIAAWARRTPAELFLFDCLWVNGLDFADRTLKERKRALHELLRRAGDRVHEVAGLEGKADEVMRKARREGWEGIIAKRLDSRYQPGRRVRDWLKIKLVDQEEFVICGWTDPEGSRVGFGSLLVGYYDETGKLRYAGRVGTGFSSADLRDLSRDLRKLARQTSACVDAPAGSDQHWVRPTLVAAVKFRGWTRGRRLREPVFLGLRRDKAAADVRLGRADAAREVAGGGGRAATGPPLTPELEALCADLERMEDSGKGATLILDGVTLKLNNLSKTFWPDAEITKGDLMRYYVKVSPWLLPALADRPLSLERYPNGIEGSMFFQQRIPKPLPRGIRTALVEHEGERADRLIGGSLPALLYTTQLAAITQHPWASRVGSLEFADYAAIDLDPGPEVRFPVVRDVARWVGEELERLKLVGFVKTSGGRGIHVFIPLAPNVPHATARLLAQLVATLVVKRHPNDSTVQRSTKRRPADKVYLDCFQNDYGKTLASVYSVRPRPGAPVSTPLRWEDLDDDFDPLDFTLRTVWDRFASVGDLWHAALRARNAVEEVIARLEVPAKKS